MLQMDPIDAVKNNRLQASLQDNDLSYVQDTIHLILKFRNTWLKPSVHLPMGLTQVSVSHLKMLINNVPKEVHKLVRSDILPDDKQNFRSLQKCYDECVLNALKLHVPESEGTIKLLKLMLRIMLTHLS